MPPALDARGLQKSYGAVPAVRGVDLRIEPGEVVALLGPNGAGKSTTVDLLLGLSRPDRAPSRRSAGRRRRPQKRVCSARLCRPGVSSTASPSVSSST